MMAVDVRRYYPYRAYLIRLLRHPEVAKYSDFTMRVQKEILFGKDNVGRYSVAVYLEFDQGNRKFEVYRPVSDHDARAEACAGFLQQWLDREGSAA